eukprot:4672589-Pyramimonas_sp.AAC.1
MICTEKAAGGDGKPDALFGEPGASTPCRPFEFECIADGDGKIDVELFLVEGCPRRPLALSRRAAVARREE